MHVSSRPAPVPPCSSGTRSPVHPRSTSVDHSAGVMPAGSSASWRSSSGPHSRSSARARHLLQCELLVVVREVHGLPYVPTASPAPYAFPDTGVTVHGRSATLPPWILPCAPEDEKFRDELRAWLDENLPPFLEAESLGDDASLSGEASQLRRQKWQRKLHEGGWAAIHWGPEYANGRTINAMQRLLYSEVMAEYRTPGMFNTNGIWQIGPMIIAWGTEEQKAQWLPSILEAEEHWCQGFSEPMAGNDLANLRTTAIYDADTDEYVVNGSKIWISSAHLATWGLFLLRTDPTAIERGKKHEGITAFVLNLKTPGIDVRPIRDMAGEELFNEIFFTDVRIPASWRLGDEGAGWMVAMGTLGYERVGIASQIAILAADLRAVVEAARSVNPAALEDPSLRDRIAKIWTEIELARLLSLRALSKIMKGEKNWPEVPFAKLSWSSMAQTLAELAVDLLGPAGRPGAGRTRLRSTGASGPASTPSSATRRSAGARPRSRRTSSPTGPSPCPASPAPDPHAHR